MSIEFPTEQEMAEREIFDLKNLITKKELEAKYALWRFNQISDPTHSDKMAAQFEYGDLQHEIGMMTNKLRFLEELVAKETCESQQTTAV